MIVRPRPPLVTKTDDPEQAAFADRKVADREAYLRQLWHDALDTEEGREFVWECVLNPLNGFEDIVGDTNTVFRLLGRRSVYLELMLAIGEHHEFLLQMQREAMKRAKRDAQEITAQRLGDRRRRQEEDLAP